LLIGLTLTADLGQAIQAFGLRQDIEAMVIFAEFKQNSVGIHSHFQIVGVLGRASV